MPRFIERIEALVVDNKHRSNYLVLRLLLGGRYEVELRITDRGSVDFLGVECVLDAAGEIAPWVDGRYRWDKLGWESV